MATILGKRQSRTQKAEPSVSKEDAMAIFRRHFEAQFKPLKPADQSTTKSKPEPTSIPEAEDMRSDSEGDDASNGSWDGVSDDEEPEPESNPTSTTTTTPEVEVVSHTRTPSTTILLTGLSKRETKAYLSSRPPPSTSTTTTSSSTLSSSKRRSAPTTTDEDAPSLVKNDLALQRLLSESHLLSSSSSSSSNGVGGSTEHIGRNRHLATDLRVGALGAKSSIYAQARMPMAQRKGIAAAAAGREAKRRREARENGIVLERPGGGAGAGFAGKKKKKGVGMGMGPPRRDRPVDAPAVGKLGGATLRLSKRDIAEIEAEGPRRGGGGKRRRR
ncbi:hypothetical protein F4810DRAFT_456590 [Camillea tinctor]|nr:hypothetical protein F4810DRAFT_456590 [Camillea tinctor]